MIKIIKCYLKLIRSMIFFIANKLARKNASLMQDSLVVIKTDAIGDYILFRNFLYMLKNEKIKHLTLICNIQYKDLSLLLDSNIVDEFIFINRSSFLKSISYHFNFIKNLKSKRYEYLLNALYSKDIISELVAKSLIANKKFATFGNTSNLPFKKLLKENKKYIILDTNKNEENIFEFYRNKEIITSFLKHINEDFMKEARFFIRNDALSLDNLGISLDISSYTLLFIGASNSKRKYHINGFIDIANEVLKNDNCIICGILDDLKNEKMLLKSINQSSFKAIGLAGKTTLVQLAILINCANLIICNDTGASHIAASMGKRVIVISNGNHLARFIPYPKSLASNYKLILPDEFKNEEFYSSCVNKEFKSHIDINSIDSKEIIKAM